MEFTYTAAFGEGSGVASDFLRAGQQRIVPDAIAYLRQLGFRFRKQVTKAEPSGFDFQDYRPLKEAAVLVRTTTVVPEG